MSHSLDRRSLLRTMVAGTLGIGALGVTGTHATATGLGSNPLNLKGNINHSVARWTYQMLSLEELCEVVKGFGVSAIDLVGPDEWHILKREGIDSSMCNGAEISLEEGWGDTRYHPELIERYRKHIDLVAD